MAVTFQSVTGVQVGQGEAAIRDPRRKFLRKALGAFISGDSSFPRLVA